MPMTSLRYWSQVHLGLGGFTEPAFTSNPSDPHRFRFDAPEYRRQRYDVFWSHYEGNVYRKIHGFSGGMKSEYDLYPSIRTVFSPAYRAIEFWAEHLLAGLLDPDAGDGVKVPSAIPILTKSPLAAALRAALATLWRDSNWQVDKDNWTRFGAALGDVGLMAFDDPARQKVFLRVIHPGIVTEVDLDPQRNCKGYLFEEMRPDPREFGPMDPTVRPPLVTYREVAERVGRRIYFSTYLDMDLYDWRDYPDDQAPRVGPEWTEDYGFIPFVWHQHRDMGLGAGWSELHPSLSKLQELDDLASKVVDQVRKCVDAPWFFSGVENVEDFKHLFDAGEAADEDEPHRDRWPYWSCPDPNARAQALVANLDLNAAQAQAMAILREIERDHPELVADDANVSGSASGRARRVARERIEARVAARRAGYDDALVRAQAMAISIGGMKGYPGYEAFDAESFARGELAHAIGDRPVFAVDTMDHIEEVDARARVLAQLTASGVPLGIAMKLSGFPPDRIDDIAEGDAFWTMVGKATAAGVPLEVVLRREGWSEDDIQEIVDAKDGGEQKALDRVQQRMAMAGGGSAGDGTAGGGDGMGAPDNLFQLNGSP